MGRGTVSDGPQNPTGEPRGDIPPEIPRDQWDRPLILPLGRQIGDKGVAMTRASTLGNALEDQQGISIWKMRQAVWGTAKRKDLVIEAASITDPMGAQKRQLGKIADAALEAAEIDAAARTGTALHSLTERVDAGHGLPEVAEEYAESLAAYAEKMSRVRVLASEVFVVNDDLQAAGTFDRLITPKHPWPTPDGGVIMPGEAVIMDLKTSSTSDYFGIKFCVQCKVYGGGTPYRHPGHRLDWPGGDRPHQKWALILHMPAGGATAEWFWVDLEQGARLAELAITVREWRKVKDLVLPAPVPAPVADSAVTDPDSAIVTAGDLLSAVRGCETEPELEALYGAHEALWTDEHTEAAREVLA